MKESNRSRSEATVKSEEGEPEWVKGILEVYERIKNDKETARNSKSTSTPDIRSDPVPEKKEEFDFFRHVYEVLQNKSKSELINYHDLYRQLGRRFCLRRSEIRNILHCMEKRGYLVLRKRGVYILAIAS